ncbi:MAG: hypothetical protein M1831_004051 [Alyxoria varia]|nr:MAG: hypothetical protein M1831_004051 [Alyxoria varia]
MPVSATSTIAAPPSKKGPKAHRGAGAFSPVDTLDSARGPLVSSGVFATEEEATGICGPNERPTAADRKAIDVHVPNENSTVPMANQREPPRIQTSPKKQQKPAMAGFTSANADTQPQTQTAQGPGVTDPMQANVPQARDFHPKAETQSKPLNDRTNTPEFGKPAQSRPNAKAELTDADLKAMRERVFASNPQKRHGSGAHGDRNRDGRPFPNAQPPNNQIVATGQPSKPASRAPFESVPPAYFSFNPNMGQNVGQKPFSNVPESSLNANSSFGAYRDPKPQFQYHGSFQQVNPSLVPPALQNIPPAGQNTYEAARQAGLAPRPSQAPPRPFQPNTARPMYSTSGFTSANAFKGGSQHSFVDLTKPTGKDPDDQFDPDKVLGIDKFGSYDPSTYVDPAQASENIKNLLEAAFEEDEEDKPKTRLRKRKEQKAAKDSATEKITEKMQELDVKSKEDVKENKESDEGAEEEEDDGSVEGLSVRLLPHQIDGVTWMLDKEVGERKRNGVLPRGGILADDMGLGKTIQALSLILSNPRPSNEEIADMPKKRRISEACNKGTLVVAPLALIKQWESEIKEKVSWEYKLKVLVHHGPSRTKRSEDLKKYDVVITTYQTLTSEHENSSLKDDGPKLGVMGVHWYRVILDEAHSIKNRNAKMTKGAYALNSVYRWCLTGTPMQNNLDELQSLIHFLQIKPYNDLKTWKDQIGTPMKSGRGGLAIKRLQYFLRALMKRRTKDVLKKDGGLTFGKGGGGGVASNSSSSTQQEGGKETEDKEKGGFKIVDRKVKTVIADFSEHEREMYDKLAARTEKSLESMMGGEKTDYIGALVLLLRLRQACNHPDLVKGNAHKEMNIGAGTNAQRKAQGVDSAGEMDALTDVMGGLSVKQAKCDVCMVMLDQKMASEGATKCDECQEAVDTEKKAREKSQNEKKKKKHARRHSKKKTSESAAAVKSEKEGKNRRFRSRKIVEDDSDEDDEEEAEGDWVVPASQHTQRKSLGRAGGSSGEDAEGGGEWLDSQDEESFATVKSTTEHTSDDSDSESLSTMEEEEEEDISSDASSDSSSGEAAAPPTSTKINHLLRILRDQSNRTHKFIIFSEFTSMLDLVSPVLNQHGYAHVRYDGRMNPTERENSLNALKKSSKNNGGASILLCSLRCGSLGLNLTAASRVVILEPFWNPFVEEQAIDRVHRINQTQDVVVYKLTVGNSVEERILGLQEKKRELARMAIEGGAAAGGSNDGVGKLSMKDIVNLFKGDGYTDGSGRVYGDAPVGAAAAGGGGGGGGGRGGGVLNAGSTRPAPPRANIPQGVPDAYARRW